MRGRRRSRRRRRRRLSRRDGTRRSSADAPTREEEMVEAARGEEGEIVPAMDTDSEAEAIRRRRLERFGANP